MYDLIKIGFLTISILDIIDIILVSLILYKLFNIIRGTIASQIFLGLIIILVLSFIAQAADFKALGWLLKLISDIWVIAFIILFQPEIRRLLVLLGRNPFFGIFVKNEGKTISDILVEAAFEMAQNQHGALMVLTRTTGMKGVVETGEQINARVSKSLIRSIFFPRSPLHDGAVIIKGNIIEAAGCTLPLTTTLSLDGMSLGMRHRAGIGITEQADAVTLIVSEETGSISVAENGKLLRGLSRDNLKKILDGALYPNKEKGIKGIFEQLTKQK